MAGKKEADTQLIDQIRTMIVMGPRSDVIKKSTFKKKENQLK